MAHVTVIAKVVSDNTGIVAEIPAILTDYGVLMPLVRYVMDIKHVRAASTVTKLVQSVGLLLDYMEANNDCYDNPKELFAGFVQRLYTGTVSDDGQDPSGLYWNGRTASVVRQMVAQLSAFSDWMAEKHGAKPFNPWRQATRPEEMLAWAAWHHKRDRAFLAHTWDRNIASLKMTRARNALLKRTPVIDHDRAKHFPEERFHDLIFRGFIIPGKQKRSRIEERLNLRDILITLLMHYGGLRMSEPFHLYVHDVMLDPLRDGSAWVRVYHPSLGQAPSDWLDAKGKPIKCSRDEYLRGKWHMRPRTEYPASHQWYAGWKSTVVDGSQHFIDVHWFPTWAGELFWKLWVFYMARRAQLQCDHPFAFVTLDGRPYAVDSFQRAHKTAVQRIGLQAAKALGTSPHGHRHAYGQRCREANLNPLVTKKAMHHASLESQVVYTEPPRAAVMRVLESAMQRQRDGENALLRPDFLSYGFEDVDPLGLLSGPNPKLTRRG